MIFKTARILIISFLTLFLAACGGGSSGLAGSDSLTGSSSTGSVAFRLGNPSRILAQIVSVQVEVVNPNTGQLLLPPQSLVFGQEVIFSPVPVGVQLVRATGFGADGNIESSDQELVEVLPGRTSRATLVLTSGDAPEPSPTPSPTTPPTTGSTLVYINYLEAGITKLAVLDGQTYLPIANSPGTVNFSTEEFDVDVAGERVFLVGFSSEIVVLDARTLAPIDTLFVGGDAPYGVAYDPDRDQVSVTDSASGFVITLDATTGTLISTLPVNGAREIRYFEGRLYVAGRSNNELHVIDSDTLSPIAGSPFNAGGVPGSLQAEFLSIDTAGRRVFVGQPPASPTNSRVAVFDIATLSFVAGSPFDLGNSGLFVSGVAYDSTQNRVLAALGSSYVLLDGTTFAQAAGSPIAAGAQLYDLAFDSTQNRIIGTAETAAVIEVLDAVTLNPVAGSPFSVAPAGSTLKNVEVVTFP